MKKIVIAPDFYKGTMCLVKTCNIGEKGMKKITPDIEIVKIPIADGGEGTVDAFVAAMGGESLEKLEHTDTSVRDKRIDSCEIITACDVKIPYTGQLFAA